MSTIAYPAIHIPVHSFVDLITNSSSETFISASGATVDAMKEIVAALLRVGGSSQSVEDVVHIGLDMTVCNKWTDWNDETFASDEDLDQWLKAKHGKSLEEIRNKDYDFRTKEELIITPKDPANPDHVKVASLLKSIIGTYDISSEWNG